MDMQIVVNHIAHSVTSHIDEYSIAQTAAKCKRDTRHAVDF
jgi:hypothetical protein